VAQIRNNIVNGNLVSMRFLAGVDCRDDAIIDKVLGTAFGYLANFMELVQADVTWVLPFQITIIFHRGRSPEKNSSAVGERL
jgi:hypothetical protein